MTAENLGIVGARLALARALSASDEEVDLEEAEQHLVRALNDGPPDAEADAGELAADSKRWQVLSALSDLADMRGRPRAALAYLVDAVISAPAPHDGELADTARRALDANDPGEGQDALPQTLIEALRDAAQRPGRDKRVAWLAARVALDRGQVGLAGDLTRGHEGEAGPQVLQEATLTAQVIELLGDGRNDDADALMRQVASGAQGSAVALARGWLLFAGGDVEGARACIEPYGDVGDPATLLVVCLLVGAARDPINRARLHDAARTAAARAARADPEGGEPMLLRAQIQLESGSDLTSGRELLATALHRITAPEVLAWWRIQDRVRDDGLYAYFRIELADVQGKGENVVAWADSYSTTGTTLDQDAAVQELLARAAHEPEVKARHLRAAVIAYRAASDVVSAEGAARQAFRLDDEVVGGLELAEVLWERSFADDPSVSPQVLVGEGLETLDSLEGRHDTSTLGRACLLRGLLLAREAAVPARGAPSTRPAESWQPLPHLLLAAYLDPSAPYTWAHLAWALGEADLRWPALWAAERASSVDAADDWIHETRAVAMLNWIGILDESLQVWMSHASESGYADPDWVRSAEGFDLLMRGQPSEAAQVLSGSAFDAYWARELRAHARVLAESFVAAEPILADLVQEAEAAASWLDACWVRLLFDVETARPLLDRVDVPEARAWPSMEMTAGIIDLIESDGARGARRLYRGIERSERPTLMREHAQVRMPMVVAAYPEKRGLAAALEECRAACVARLGELDLQPSLLAEQLSGDSWCAVPELAAVVSLLLDVPAEGARLWVGPEPPAELDELRGSPTLRQAWAVIAGA